MRKGKIIPTLSGQIPIKSNREYTLMPHNTCMQDQLYAARNKMGKHYLQLVIIIYIDLQYPHYIKW
jgi:hypothetical protein